jgi:hypothetical protein
MRRGALPWRSAGLPELLEKDNALMRHSTAMTPADFAWYYRHKRGRYRHRTDVPIAKPRKGKRRK